LRQTRVVFRHQRFLPAARRSDRHSNRA
jgi:hypothetical protein